VLKKKFLLIVICLYTAIGLNAQDTLQISGTIISSKTATPLAFAKVYNNRFTVGTVTAEDGSFVLDHLHQDDTLFIKYVGYATEQLPLADYKNGDTIVLIENDNLLNKVDVYSDDPFLYELILASKKKKNLRTATAKSYLFVESKSDDKTIEMLEGYYNGSYKGYDVKELDLKAGRIGVSPTDQNFVVSTETSKAILKHTLFEESSLFPDNPFCLKKRKLIKSYRLLLQSKYLDKANHTIYEIRFLPRDNKSAFFEGKVWIDSNSTDLLRIELLAENATVHPFTTHGSARSIENLTLSVNKEFEAQDKDLFISLVDFNYSYQMHSLNGRFYDIETNALLSAFDFQSAYDLPFFELEDAIYQDYSEISAFPKNDFFWNNSFNFQLRKESTRVQDFIENEAKLTNVNMFRPNAYQDKGFMDCEYVQWSLNRIMLKPRPIPTDNFSRSNRISYESNKYSLSVQIFMDVNESNDSLHVLTSTVFDPFNSYFFVEINGASLAFLNMFFDFVEVYRRELHDKLSQLSSKEEVIFEYNKAMTDLENLSFNFQKDCQHGTSKVGMIKWNNYIREKTGIDNLDTFNVNFK
jgi:hypothetical protein